VSSRHGAALVAVLLILACAEGPERASEDLPSTSAPSASAPAPAPRDSTATRPATRTDTIPIEGMPEVIELDLVRSSPGFPLPFTTYATSDFAVEAGEHMGLPTVKLVAVFAGVRNEDAFVEIAAYPAGTSEGDAPVLAQGVLGEGAEAVPPSETSDGWAVAEWRLMDSSGPDTVIARLRLGRRKSHYFHVLQRYPAAYADGMAPRVWVILEEWRWEDGSGLSPGSLLEEAAAPRPIARGSRPPPRRG